MRRAITPCPHLGCCWDSASPWPTTALVGELMRCAQTLQQALLDFTSWQPGYSSGAIVYLHPLGEIMRWAMARRAWQPGAL